MVRGNRDYQAEAAPPQIRELSGVRRAISIDGGVINDIINIIPTSKPDELILADYVLGRVLRVKASATQLEEVLWYTDLGEFIGSVDYIIDSKRILVPSMETGKVWELDVDDGSLLNTVTLAGSGYQMWMICSIQEEPRKALAARFARHQVGIIDLDAGTWTVIFGVDGTSRCDSTHLNTPTSIEYHHEYGYYLIVDAHNNRLLKIHKPSLDIINVYLMAGLGDMTVKRDPVDESYNCRKSLSTDLCSCFSRSAMGKYNLVPSSWVSALDGRRTLARLSVPDRFDKPMWGVDPNDIWVAAATTIYCLDLRFFKETPKLGYSAPLVTGESVLAGATFPESTDSNATVLNGIDTGEIEIEIYSSKTATAYIDVPEKRLNGFEVDLNFTWKEFDYYSLDAGKVTGYILTHPPAIFRVRVVMGGDDGTISIYYTKR